MWFTEGNGDRVGKLDWVLQSTAVQSDGSQGTTLSIDGQDGSTFDAHNGNLHVTVGFDCHMQGGT
jgi:hypothetical protein